MIFRQDDSPRDTARLRRINPRSQPLTDRTSKIKTTIKERHLDFLIMSSISPSSFCPLYLLLRTGRILLCRTIGARSKKPCRSAGLRWAVHPTLKVIHHVRLEITAILGGGNNAPVISFRHQPQAFDARRRNVHRHRKPGLGVGHEAH